MSSLKSERIPSEQFVITNAYRYAALCECGIDNCAIEYTSENIYTRFASILENDFIV